MTDRNDNPVDGLDRYLERFMSYPHTARTDLGAVTRRRRPLRSRIAAPAGLALLTGALVAVLALALAHHHGAGGASGVGDKGKQLDMVLRTVNGTGHATTPLVPFPHARYTFFTEQDPPDCLRGVQVQNADGQYVAGDRADLIPQPDVRGQDSAPLVQENLSQGDYRLRVDTDTARCTWRVEEILNSMSSPAAPPHAEPAPSAPPATSVSSVNPGQPLIVPVTGLYRIDWTVTPPSPGTTCTNVGFSLRDSAGDLEYQGIASGIAAFFLGSGEHPVTVQADCAWRMSLSPMLGPLGGGVQSFAAPPLPPPYTAVEVATMSLENGAVGACQDEAMVGTRNSVRGTAGSVSMTSPYATWTEQSPVSCPPSVTPPDSAPAGTYVIVLDDCREPKAQTITLTVDAAHRVTVVKIVDSPYGQALAHHSSCRDQ